MRYILNPSFIIAILLALIFLPEAVFAHNGSRDELGGHFRNADCVYILHEPTPIAKNARNVQELIRLINQYNSNSECAAELTRAKIDLEGYTFQEEGGKVPESEPAASEPPKAAASPGKLDLGKSYEAQLADCTDGDTAIFTINGKEYKTRFLYIDTPESTRTKEAFGPEAARYTCSFLKQGKIILETDGGNLFDKYDRLLAWVWVDDKLHQEEITKAGLVEDFYDYGSYKYESRILAAMAYAKENEKGMYGGTRSTTETPPAEQKDPSEKQPKKEKEQGSGDAGQQRESPPDNANQPEQKEEGFGCGLIKGSIFALLFYLIWPIKKVLGKRTLLAHRMWSEKWWLNLLLGIIYAFLCYITLLLLQMEVLHIFKKSKTKKR